MARKRFSQWFAVTLGLAHLGLGFGPASAEVAPKAPVLCIDGPDGCPNDTRGGLKWHPGHYLKVGTTENDPAELSRVMDSPRLLGADIAYYWADIETSKGIYDFSVMDRDLNWLKSRGKRLIVNLLDRRFNSTSPSGIVPAYLEEHLYATKTGYGVALWRRSVMDRYVEIVRAICSRYDNDPNFEILRVPNESSPGNSATSLPADYSREAHADELKRLFAAASAACPNTIVVASVNSLAGQEESLIDAAYKLPIGFATPDAMDDIGHKVFAGQNSKSFDYRGQIAHYTIASAPVLGGKDDNGPAANVINWAQSNGVTHLSWVSWQTSAGNTWADILSAVAADPSLHTACPSAYTQGCSSK